MVIDDQSFIVARDINGEPSWAGKSATHKLEVSCVGFSLSYAAPCACG